MFFQKIKFFIFLKLINFSLVIKNKLKKMTIIYFGNDKIIKNKFNEIIVSYE